MTRPAQRRRRAPALPILAFALALPAATLAAAVPELPVLQPGSAVEERYGVAVPDPYRSLEDLADPVTLDWFRREDAHARAVLDALPGRDALRQRIAALDAADSRVTDVQLGGDEVFYLKRGPGDAQFRLYRRHGLAGDEQLLVDPASVAGGDRSAAIDYYRASPNGKRVAFGVSTQGSENATLYVLDVQALRSLGPPVAGARDGAPSWRFDSTVLFYHRLRRPAAGAPASELLRNSRAYMRTFQADGTFVDAPVLGRGLSPDVDLDPDDSPSVIVSPVSPYAIGVVEHGVERELVLYVAPLAQVRGTETPWRRLAGPERGIVAFDLRGEWIYAVTHEGAPRYRVVRASLQDPRALEPGHAEEVLGESARVVTGLGVAKDALYVQQSQDGVDHLLRLEFNVNLRKEPAARAAAPAASARRGSASGSTAGAGSGRAGKPAGSGGTAAANRRAAARERAPAALPKTAGIAREREIVMPFAGAIQERVTDPLRPGALVRLAGWTQSPGYYTVDGKTGAVARTALMPPSAADFSRYTVTSAKVRSDDVEVPVTIVHARGAVHDGNAPLLLDAYGAYGESFEPAFRPSLVAWLDRGGIYAVAHVRGGGELGRPWHLAGRRETKPNTWKDLIAVADWLVRERWTSPAKLAGTGASAGALAVVNAMVERPDLFAAVASLVGFHDPLRSEAGTAGPANATEFGSVADEPGFRALLAMSPYARVRDGTRYPAVLLTAGFHDTRVDPWDPGKMAARLQAIAQGPGGSGKPVLLRVDFAGGHGIAATRDERIDLEADLYAFLLWQLLEPGFAPR